VQQILVFGQFHGEAAAPSGQPPQTDPRATSVSLTATNSDGSDAGIERASYQNHACHTGETTFSESGTLRLDDGSGEWDIVSVSDGTLGASADPDVLHGAVVYKIVAGRGRFEGASGLVTSNFVLRPAAGEFDETQVAIVFVP
jgi:hypothetical protein